MATIRAIIAGYITLIIGFTCGVLFAISAFIPELNYSLIISIVSTITYHIGISAILFAIKIHGDKKIPGKLIMSIVLLFISLVLGITYSVMLNYIELLTRQLFGIINSLYFGILGIYIGGRYIHKGVNATHKIKLSAWIMTVLNDIKSGIMPDLFMQKAKDFGLLRNDPPIFKWENNIKIDPPQKNIEERKIIIPPPIEERKIIEPPLSEERKQTPIEEKKHNKELLNRPYLGVLPVKNYPERSPDEPVQDELPNEQMENEDSEKSSNSIEVEIGE